MTADLKSSARSTATDELTKLEFLTAFRTRSLFKFLTPDLARELVMHHARFIAFDEGERIRPRPPSKGVYVVTSGAVKMQSPGTDGAQVGSITPGRAIELGACLRNALQYNYHWIAGEECEVLELDVEFLEALRSDHATRTYLEFMTDSFVAKRVTKDLRIIGVPETANSGIVTSIETAPCDRLPEKVKTEKFLVGSDDDTIQITQDGIVIALLNAGDILFLDPSQGEIAIRGSTDTTSVKLIFASTIARHAGERPCQILHQLLGPTIYRQKQAIPTAGESSTNTVEPNETDEENPLSIDMFRAKQRSRRPRLARIPFVRQHDEMDCGAACMSIVARHHGRKISIAQYRELVHVTREGASLFSLQKGAEKSGFAALGIMSGIKGLQEMQAPFICLMQYHYIVVFHIDDKTVIASDPAVGRITFTIEEFKREFSQYVLLLAPTKAFYEFPVDRNTFLKYFGLLRGFHREIMALGTLIFVSLVLGLVVPFATQYMFDSLSVSTSETRVLLIVAAILLVSIIMRLISLVEGYLVANLSARLDVKLVTLFLNRIYKLPLSYFAVRRVGDFISRFEELRNIRHFITGKPFYLMTQILRLIVYSFVLAAYSTKIMGVVAIGLIPVLGIILGSTPILKRLEEKLFRANSKATSRIMEYVSGKDTLRNIGGEIAARWRWAGLELECQELRRRYAYVSMSFGVLSSLINQLVNITVTIVSIHLLSQNELTFGQMISMAGIAASVISPAVSLLAEWKSFNDVAVSFSRLDDIFTAATENRMSVERAPSERLAGEIEFRNLEFRYGGEMSPVVLSNINLKIEKGTSVAFVGRSGSGKTSLAYLINRLYTPSKGQILLDGIDSERLDLRWLRSQIGFIIQENSLFRGTIMDNIALGDPAASFEKVVSAAQQADAHDFILKLPLGYLTELGEGGSGLSGGQKQRINIARAVYNNPPIMILDEATSALDAISEQTIINNVVKNSQERTTIIIAHRLNTVIHCNKIVCFDRGRIVETGTHMQLLAQNGYYSKLFRHQLAGA